MTTFADMQEAVIVQTKRPELVTLTDSAIRMATIRAHHVDFFSRDAAEQVLTFTPDTTLQFTDFANIYTTVARLRTLDFMQATDITAPYTPTENLEYVNDYKDFWDQDNCLRSSVFTLRGRTLRVRFAVATGRALLNYYQNPDTTSATYSSWIADNHKEELAMWAAGIIWARTGFQEQARTAQMLVEDFKALLVESYLSSKK